MAFRRRVINSCTAGQLHRTGREGSRADRARGICRELAHPGRSGIPLALLYVAVLMVFWWELQRVEWARRLTAVVVWIGAGFLLASGAALPLLQGAPRFDLQRFTECTDICGCPRSART